MLTSSPRPVDRPAAGPTTPAAALNGHDLVLRYGAKPVVHGVSLALEPGRATALVGPNGSGKSTLLRSLSRLHRIDDGRVTLGAADGTPERDAALLSSRQFAREVTLFSQSRPAPQGLTVAEVVAFGRHPYRRGFGGPSVEDRSAVDRAMGVTGVRDMAGRLVGELSGGEMQRVWLAACLAQDTGVVLLDEPTNHLSPRLSDELEAALGPGPGAVVMASHDRWLRERRPGRLSTAAVNGPASVVISGDDEALDQFAA
ncbi:ATP-binding cassette domain-containing protein, partial [Streptomyces sp. NPDC060187]|uniref:ABC transporter ATP-binding protein n=1 Tax=Streptomyces sp. NPDC060187 TaxID=3347067 RepID=UPI00366A1E9A